MKKAGIFQEMINVEVVNWGKGLYEWQKNKKKKKRVSERKEMIEKEE